MFSVGTTGATISHKNEMCSEGRQACMCGMCKTAWDFMGKLIKKHVIWMARKSNGRKCETPLGTRGWDTFVMSPSSAISMDLCYPVTLFLTFMCVPPRDLTALLVLNHGGRIACVDDYRNQGSNSLGCQLSILK